ncbi:hypothetical protein LI177_05345 [bacterium 210820-DFI.6.37]|nr:hypothetical protein [bacterium 210820-DFI.6.37]
MDKITKEDLKLYNARKRELKNKMKRLGNLKVEYVGDSVRLGDAKRGPIIKVQGYNDEVVERRAKELKNRIAELEEDTEKVELWINSLPEGEERNLIEMYYIDGMTQREIAKELGEGHTREEVAKKIQRFWKRIKKYDL